MSENNSTEEGRGMKRRPALLVFSVALLCTFHQTSSSTAPSEVGGRNNNMAVPRIWPKQNISLSYFGNETFGNRGNTSRPMMMTPKRQERTGRIMSGFPFNASRGNAPTVTSEERASSGAHWIATEDDGAPLCAYRVFEGGVGGQLCFRHTKLGFRCHRGDCRTAVSQGGTLVANMLTNGSVLLQWSHQGPGEKIQGTTKALTPDPERQTGAEQTAVLGNLGEKNWLHTPPPERVSSRRHHRRGGFELSCWWNGSYTQFECAGVHLGSGCRDFLLTELHENVPYRVCLRSLAWRVHSGPAQREGPAPGDCVEFTVSASGMQDIVVAMTTVGGAICVMLVIICLLVAYITENIMSPATQHTYSYHSHR